MLIQFATQKVEFKSLDDIGMRAKMQEQLMELLSQNGLFMFSSLPAGGLTTTMDVVLSNIDRFVRAFVAVNDEAKGDRDIENVAITTYSKAAGESPATVLPKLVRTYPDVIVVREVPDVETLQILVDQVGERRAVIMGIRAKEAVEALLRALMLKIPPAEFASVVVGVLNIRLAQALRGLQGSLSAAAGGAQATRPAGRTRREPLSHANRADRSQKPGEGLRSL